MRKTMCVDYDLFDQFCSLATDEELRNTTKDELTAYVREVCATDPDYRGKDPDELADTLWRTIQDYIELNSD